MSLLHIFMEKQAPITLNSRTALRAKSSPKRQEEGPLTMCCDTVSSLLETYDTDIMIAEASAGIKRLTHAA